MKRIRIMGLCLIAALAASAMSAVSASAQPTDDFAIFKACPLSELENPHLGGGLLCFVARSEKGQFTVGPVKTPLHVLTVQGGSIVNEETGAETFVAPNNGEEALSKVALRVPGGLRGVKLASFPLALKQRWRKAKHEKETGGPNPEAYDLYETVELVGTPGISRSNLINAEGPALTLPIRIHLTNPGGLLSEECFVGSAAEPIVQHLTTGTSGALTGKVGTIRFKDEFQYLDVKHNLVVDNEYPVPATTGCGGPNQEVVNPAISAALGLPAAAGASVTAIEGTLYNSTAEATRASEK
jgi:hypothetical protein